MDYLEIMDFCGYDLKEADAMARRLYPIDKNLEGIKRGVAAMESESNVQDSGRLRRPRCSKGPGR